MCGRIVLIASAQDMTREFGLADPPRIPPRYNIPPAGPVAAILAEGPDRVLRFLQWGIQTPGPGRGGGSLRMINARAETIAHKTTFAEAFARRRCLIPVNGFYEWKRTGRRARPFLIRRPTGGLFTLAGIWSRWEYPGARVLDACAIITTEAADFMRDIHHRMPVVIAPGQRQKWLETPPAQATSCEPLLRPVTGDLIAHAVDPRVGSPDFDEPACLEPWRPGREGQLDLFASRKDNDD